MHRSAICRLKAKARAKADPSVISHGTIAGYDYWGCRCPECKGIKSESQSAYYARRKRLQAKERQARENATAFDPEG